ncbi:hypothetical protein ABK040_000824 [Willaertia magna]
MLSEGVVSQIKSNSPTSINYPITLQITGEAVPTKGFFRIKLHDNTDYLPVLIKQDKAQKLGYTIDSFTDGTLLTIHNINAHKSNTNTLYIVGTFIISSSSDSNQATTTTTLSSSNMNPNNNNMSSSSTSTSTQQQASLPSSSFMSNSSSTFLGNNSQQQQQVQTNTTTANPTMSGTSHTTSAATTATSTQQQQANVRNNFSQQQQGNRVVSGGNVNNMNANNNNNNRGNTNTFNRVVGGSQQQNQQQQQQSNVNNNTSGNTMNRFNQQQQQRSNQQGNNQTNQQQNRFNQQQQNRSNNNSMNTTNNRGNLNNSSGGNNNNVEKDLSKLPITPLIALNIWQPAGWVIKARITKKNDLKTWSKATSSGCLFSVNLIDEQETEMRGTFFNQAAKTYSEKLEERKVYYFMGGKIKRSNKQFTKMSHDYEITFSEDCIVQEVNMNDEEAKSIPQGHFRFIPFYQLSNIPNNSLIDVIGIVKKITEPQDVKPKENKQNNQNNNQFNNQEKISIKRNISIINRNEDGSEALDVLLTLWGEQYCLDDKIPFQVGDLVLFSRVKKSEFKGISINAMGNSQILNMSNNNNLNNINEKFDLLNWFNGLGVSSVEEVQTKSLSVGDGSTMKFSRKFTLEDLDYITFEEVEKEEYKQKSVRVRSVLTRFRDSDPWYEACLNEDCKGKRVKRIDNNNGVTAYQCDKCGITSDACAYRYLSKFSLSDYTCSRWMSAFDTCMTPLLNGKTAFDLHEERESDPLEYNKTMSQPQFRYHSFRLRVGIDKKSEVPALQFSATGRFPVEWNKEAKSCLGIIKAYQKQYNI